MGRVVVRFDKYAKTLETLANAAIVVVALLATVVLVRQLSTPNAGRAAAAEVPAAAAPRGPVTGSPISVPGVTWGGREQTLVLVLSTTCRFCTNSAPFYHRLVRESQRTGKTRLVAVLPQATPDATRYLNDLGVAISEIVQAPLATLGARGTPTLILVDGAGVVKHTWAGQLPPQRESEVLAYF